MTVFIEEGYVKRKGKRGGREGGGGGGGGGGGETDFLLPVDMGCIDLNLSLA